MAKKASETSLVSALATDDKMEIPSFDALIVQLAQTGEVVDATELREEMDEVWQVVRDKDTLIGKAFLIVSWQVNQGENGPFVSVSAITADSRRIIINDGSKNGIRGQIDALAAAGEVRSILVRNGLKRSKPYRTTVMQFDKATDTVVEKEITGQPIYSLDLS